MNKVKAVFSKGSYRVQTSPLWQYDYGQTLEIVGLDLSSAYEVHFSNDPTGVATTSLGNEDGVAIPDVYLKNGKVYAWLYLHTTENDGETVYQIEIPVRERASISNQPPTPVQQDIIEQTIAALENAVEETEAVAESIPGRIDEAFGEITAEATTLEPGSPATASFANKVLSLGIPEGQKGEQGDKGDNAYLHIRYSTNAPTKNSDMHTTPDNWMGVCTDHNETDPTSYTAYAWNKVKGDPNYLVFTDDGEGEVTLTYEDLSDATGVTF